MDLPSKSTTSLSPSADQVSGRNRSSSSLAHFTPVRRQSELSGTASSSHLAVNEHAAVEEGAVEDEEEVLANDRDGGNRIRERGSAGTLTTNGRSHRGSEDASAPAPTTSVPATSTQNGLLVPSESSPNLPSNNVGSRSLHNNRSKTSIHSAPPAVNEDDADDRDLEDALTLARQETGGMSASVDRVALSTAIARRGTVGGASTIQSAGRAETLQEAEEGAPQQRVRTLFPFGDYPGSGTSSDPFVVSFLPNDKTDPMQFKKSTKWIITILTAFSTLCVSFSSSSFSGGVIPMMKYFGIGEEVMTLGLSLFVLGFALGPMVWAPFSELFGRRILFLLTYAPFCLFNIGPALAKNIETVLICRFLGGIFGSSPLTNSGGVISDMFSPYERGMAMSIFAGAPFAGPCLGPVVGGFIGVSASWRVEFWVMFGFSAVMYVSNGLFIPETYAPVLLQRRAAKLQKDATARRQKELQEQSSRKSISTAEGKESEHDQDEHDDIKEEHSDEHHDIKEEHSDEHHDIKEEHSDEKEESIKPKHGSVAPKKPHAVETVMGDPDGTVHFVSVYDLKKPAGETLGKKLKTNMTRPFALLFQEPICSLFAIYAALVYGTLYLLFEAFPIVFQQERGWSAGIGGLPFLGVGLGMVVGILINVKFNNMYMRKLEQSPSGRLPPEDRLPACMVGGCLLPIGLFWFAWTTFPSIHWIVPTIAGAPFGAGMVLVFLPMMNYLVDAYLLYAASSLAANAVLRSIFGAVFPLFAGYMYRGMGTQWATFFVGCLSLICVPIPFLFYRYGAKIRAKSKYAPDPVPTNVEKSKSKEDVGRRSSASRRTDKASGRDIESQGGMPMLERTQTEKERQLEEERREMDIWEKSQEEEERKEIEEYRRKSLSRKSTHHEDIHKEHTV